jgi:hypothetical protein
MGRIFKRDGVEYMITPDGDIQKQTYGDTKEFKNKKKRQKKAIEKAAKTPGTSDDEYPVDYSKLKRKPMPKYKAKGGLIHGRPKLAKKGF